MVKAPAATAIDSGFMDLALFHAARGRGRTTPNPAVGAVVVSEDGVVVGTGYHARAGEPHAEIHALSAAGARARGATLYCTLEPCAHTGRTGPCVVPIVAAGIRRVVAAMQDPNPLVQGRGVSYLRAHGVDVTVGVDAMSARALNQPFLTTIAERRPFVLLKAAVSLDGRIAARPGVRTRLTSEPANRHAQSARAEIDAIAVGSGTVLADNPLLTPRGVYRDRPLVRVIFDRRLRTPVDAAILSTRAAGPVMIVTMAEAAETPRAQVLRAQGAELLIADGTVRGGLRQLAARGIGSILIEGGAGLHAAAWDEGVVDFVRLYVTPHVLGPEGIPMIGGRRVATTFLSERRTETLGSDVLIEGYVHGPR